MAQVKKNPFCKIHKDQETKTWDNHCKKPLCMECIYDHQQTSCTMIKPAEVLQGINAILERQKNTLMQIEDQQVNNYKHLDTIQKSFNQEKNQKIDEMKGWVGKMKDELDNLQKRMEEQYQNFDNDLQNQVNIMKQSITFHQNKCKELIQQTEQLLNSKDSEIDKIQKHNDEKLEININNWIQDEFQKKNFYKYALRQFESFNPSFKQNQITIDSVIEFQTPIVTSIDILESINQNYQENQVPDPPKIKCNFTFDENRKNEHIQLENQNNTAKKTGSYYGWSSVLTNEVIKDGITEIQFQIDDVGNEEFAEMYIGLLQDGDRIDYNSCLNGFEKPPEKVWAINYNGFLYEPKESCTNKHVEKLSFQTGDLIKLKIDLEKNKLDFFKGENHIMTLDEIEGDVVPFVCMGGTVQTVTIKESCKQLGKISQFAQEHQFDQDQEEEEMRPEDSSWVYKLDAKEPEANT